MRLPRDLSGDELVKILCRDWSYRKVHQAGSHLVLETEEPAHQRIAVPRHRNLRIGTLNAILRSVSEHKGMLRDEILRGR